MVDVVVNGVVDVADGVVNDVVDVIGVVDEVVGISLGMVSVSVAVIDDISFAGVVISDVVNKVVLFMILSCSFLDFKTKIGTTTAIAINIIAALIVKIIKTFLLKAKNSICLLLFKKFS